MTFKTQEQISKGCGKSFIINLMGNAAICGTLKDNKLCSSCKALLQYSEDIIREIENIENPYPEDIFPEIKLTKFLTNEVNYILKTKFGFSLDRLSAELMRRARSNFKEQIKQSIIGETK